MNTWTVCIFVEVCFLVKANSVYILHVNQIFSSFRWGEEAIHVMDTWTVCIFWESLQAKLKHNKFSSLKNVSLKTEADSLFTIHSSSSQRSYASPTSTENSKIYAVWSPDATQIGKRLRVCFWGWFSRHFWDSKNIPEPQCFISSCRCHRTAIWAL